MEGNFIDSATLTPSPVCRKGGLWAQTNAEEEGTRRSTPRQHTAGTITYRRQFDVVAGTTADLLVAGGVVFERVAQHLDHAGQRHAGRAHERAAEVAHRVQQHVVVTEFHRVVPPQTLRAARTRGELVEGNTVQGVSRSPATRAEELTRTRNP